MRLSVLGLVSLASFSLACPAVRPPKAAEPSVAAPTETGSGSHGAEQPLPPVPVPTGPADSPSPTPEPTDNEGASNPPQSDLSTDVISGKSTFYGGNLGGGTCSFSGYTLPAGLYGVAYSGQAWNNAASCGACIKVTGPNGNTISAMVRNICKTQRDIWGRKVNNGQIVDQCPECEKSHLDLFQNGFEQIGTLSAGIIPTSYTFTSCGISSPIVLRNKSGTSPYWFSMQVINANEPVATLEVSIDGGNSWKSTTRQFYNYFENSSGFGTSTVNVRVTSTTGKVLVIRDVQVASDSKTTATSNF
jgi:expansin